MAAAADVDEVAAADIICSLRGADLAGWTPPWRRAETEPSPAPAARREGEMVWPAVARGKRSRRRSPSAGSAATGKGRWGRGSPASPLDYSGGSGSGSAASTSGGEDGGGFCSPGDRRAPANKVGSIGRPQLTFPTPPPTLASGQRPRKKLKLPEVQQMVRSLSVENESLREEMRALQRACKALSKENDKLELSFHEIVLGPPSILDLWKTRLGQSDLQNEIISKDPKGTEQIDRLSVMQSTRNIFVLPDLNLPPQDNASVSTVH